MTSLLCSVPLCITLSYNLCPHLLWEKRKRGHITWTRSCHQLAEPQVPFPLLIQLYTPFMEKNLSLLNADYVPCPVLRVLLTKYNYALNPKALQQHPSVHVCSFLIVWAGDGINKDLEEAQGNQEDVCSCGFAICHLGSHPNLGNSFYLSLSGGQGQDTCFLSFLAAEYRHVTWDWPISYPGSGLGVRIWEQRSRDEAESF